MRLILTTLLLASTAVYGADPPEAQCIPRPQFEAAIRESAVQTAIANERAINRAIELAAANEKIVELTKQLAGKETKPPK